MWIARIAGFCWILMLIGAVVTAAPACAQSSNLKRSAFTTMPLAMTSEAVGQSTSKAVLTKWANPTQDLTHLPQSTTTAPLLQNTARTPYSCAAESIVCYDERRRQTVVPLTRSLMPQIPGFTKVGLTIKRSGINLRYSF